MAFTAISSTVIQVGKAIKAELLALIKSNEDDLDSRLASVEAVANKIVIFDDVVVNATASSTLTGLALWQATAAIDLTDSKIGIFLKGSLGGTLEIDIKKSSSLDFTSAVSVFTTKPKVTFSTASDYDESANAVFDNTSKLVASGDWLRLDVTSLPTGGIISKFTALLIAEAQ